MGIDLRGRDIRVAQHHLDGSKVRTPLKKMACERMPKKMGGDPLAKASPPAIYFDAPPEPLPTHPFARTIDEKEGALPSLGKPFASGVQIQG